MGFLRNHISRVAAGAALLVLSAGGGILAPRAANAAGDCAKAIRQLELDFLGKLDHAGVAEFEQQLSPSVKQQLEQAIVDGKLTPKEAADWAKSARGSLGHGMSQADLDQTVQSALARLDQPGASQVPHPLFSVEANPEIKALAQRMEQANKDLPQLTQDLEAMNSGRGPPSPFAEQLRAKRMQYRAELQAQHPELTGPRAKELNPLVEQRMKSDPEVPGLETRDKQWLSDRKTELEQKIAKTRQQLAQDQQAYDAKVKPLLDQIPPATDRGFPYGFESRTQYQAFSREYSSGLKKTLQERFGLGEDLQVDPRMQGSSVTGRSSVAKDGVMAKMYGAHSDIDVGVEVSDDAFRKIQRRIDDYVARNAGRDPELKKIASSLKARQNWGPGLTYEDPASPMGKLVKDIGLSDFLTQMQNRYGRKVSIMFYKPGGMAARGLPEIPFDLGS
jgi:hypothetical protein